MAHLIIYADGGIEQHALRDHTWIGRQEKNTISVDDPVVSGEHCLIYLDPSRGYALRDLKSRNGTFVNGTKVDGEVMLRGGDEDVRWCDGIGRGYMGVCDETIGSVRQQVGDGISAGYVGRGGGDPVIARETINPGVSGW